MLFDSFIGNRKVMNRLRRKLREGRFPHGLIFSGPEGVGKHTCAVMLAKTLISETTLPLTEVAFASGFASIRRFNAAFRAVYRRPPTAVRRARRRHAR